MPRIFEFNISGKRLLIGLLVTAVPISLIALLASTRTGRNAENAAGQNLRIIAESVAAIIQERVRANVVEAGLMASDSAVIAEAIASNAKYRGQSDDAIQASIERVDSTWNAPEGAAAVRRVLESKASQALRRMIVTEPAFKRITLTDARGATIGATHKTIDYYQADEEYWNNIYVNGQGAISLTDVLYDEPTRTYYIGVGVPVVDQDNEVLGTLDAIVDISSLFPLLHQPELGPNGHLELIKSDGSVIAGTREVSLANPTKSVDWAALQDAQSSFVGHSSGYMRAKFGAGRDSILAFADTGLRDEFRKLDWFVVGSQDASVLLAGAWLTQMTMMAIALLTLAGVVFLAVYFTLHAQSEIDEIAEEMQTVTSSEDQKAATTQP